MMTPRFRFEPPRERGDRGARAIEGPVWVVIPTYNEADNVQRIVDAAVAELDRLVPQRYRILVVDDGSPDGTGEIADRLAHQGQEVEVLHRMTKAGLGRAYLAGFRRALAAGAALVIQMDADYSHDPRYLGGLLTAIEDADVVLGSRYVEGGGVRNWSVRRRLISKAGGMYARGMLGVGVGDLTGGFKCIRREVLDAIDLQSLRGEGYVFQIEVTYRALMAGFRVREVPIVFVDRTAGKSKMSARIAAEAMWMVPRLRISAAAARSLRARREPAATLQCSPPCTPPSPDRRLAITGFGGSGRGAPGHMASVAHAMTRSAPASRSRTDSSSNQGKKPRARPTSS
jgi:dolichol-phosphate mannosyltransferase